MNFKKLPSSKQLLKNLIEKDKAIINDTFLDSILTLYFTLQSQALSVLRTGIHAFSDIYSYNKKHNNNLIDLDETEMIILNSIKKAINKKGFEEKQTVNDKLDFLIEIIEKSIPVDDEIKELLLRNNDKETTLSQIQMIKIYFENIWKVFNTYLIYLKQKQLIEHNFLHFKSIEGLLQNIYNTSHEALILASKGVVDPNSELEESVEISNGVVPINRVEKAFINLSSGQSLPVGIPTLDKYLNGGLQRERIYTIIGLPGSGKSTILLNIAYNAWNWLSKYNLEETKTPVVLYITLENSIDETLVRLAKIATETSNISNNYNKINNKFKEIAKTSNLILKYFRPRTISPINILDMINEIEKDKIKKVELVIIDYLGKLGFGFDSSLLGVSSSSTATWEKLGYIMDELKYVSVLGNTRILTAHQFNREAKVKERKKVKASEESIGDSWKIEETSDVIIFSHRLSPSKQEFLNTYNKSIQYRELVIGKQRFGPDSISTIVKIDFSIWKLSELSKDEIEKIQWEEENSQVKQNETW